MPVTSMIEVRPASIPNQQTVHGREFPHVLRLDSLATLDAVGEWVRGCRDQLLSQASEHGAILFRGFPLVSAADFDAFVAAFDLQNFPYNQSLSNAVRINWTERVFSANESARRRDDLFAS